jgi:hypothetical protein
VPDAPLREVAHADYRDWFGDTIDSIRVSEPFTNQLLDQ